MVEKTNVHKNSIDTIVYSFDSCDPKTLDLVRGIRKRVMVDIAFKAFRKEHNRSQTATVVAAGTGV